MFVCAVVFKAPAESGRECLEQDRPCHDHGTEQGCSTDRQRRSTAAFDDVCEFSVIIALLCTHIAIVAARGQSDRWRRRRDIDWVGRGAN